MAHPSSSPSPRLRGEGRDEGALHTVRNRGETPHPDPLRSPSQTGVNALVVKNGEREKGGACVPLALLGLIVAWAVLAANFPALTGRIVDQANVISAEARSALEPKLAALETKTGIHLILAP